jgi:hypothetical protein
MGCGDCLMGNYIFCVKGTEGISVDSRLPSGYQTFCCRNSNNCTYIRNDAWNCSSKYRDIDRFRVCPFYRSQCGASPQINLTGVGDQRCMKVRSLAAGNACFYYVSTQCAAPRFLLSNTNTTIFRSRLVSNQTILRDEEYEDVQSFLQIEDDTEIVDPESQC